MILPVYVFGHPILRKVAGEIDKDFNNLKQFIEYMFETMSESDGIGLAAPQVGKSVRIFIVDATSLEDKDPSLKNFKKVFINPIIMERTGEITPFNEGCLSIPGIREDISRESEIRITYYDTDFNFYDELYNGVPSRIIQHEYDHLDGILFTDRVAPLKKRLLKNKLSGISKGKFDVDYKTVLPGKIKVFRPQPS